MKLDKQVVDRLQQLIDTGKELIKQGLANPQNRAGVLGPPDREGGSQWATSGQSILVQVFGESGVHFQRFSKITYKEFGLSDMQKAIGVLSAAKDDYEHGFLLNMRRLVEAEVFDDFLEQAEYLLDAGYHPPAAVIAGSVLEDGLRKLCGTNGVTLPPKPKLDTMNAELCKKGVYNLLRQKQITGYADLRNKAAHGEWTEFSADDVRQLIAGIRVFMAEHFT